MHWRWIVDAFADEVPPAAPGARNMAIDAALLAAVVDGAPPAIRLYRWDPACLSFGRNQVARGAYDPERAVRLGLDVVRRPTGGLAVLHDAELTYAVVSPSRLLGGPRMAYRRIHGAIANALARVGVETALAGTPPAPLPAPDAGAPACFAAPAGGEVVARGRKLVGSAQRTERRTFLQHGSILLEGTQRRVAALRVRPGEDGEDGSIAVADVLGRVPPLDELASALCAGFTALVDGRLEACRLSDAERALAAGLEDTYRDDAWTWRR